MSYKCDECGLHFDKRKNVPFGDAFCEECLIKKGITRKSILSSIKDVIYR